jgi:hypothetical protein
MICIMHPQPCQLFRVLITLPINGTTPSILYYDLLIYIHLSHIFRSCRQGNTLIVAN